MRRILFILFLLLGAPAHAVAIPGVTNGRLRQSGGRACRLNPMSNKRKPPTRRWQMCWKTRPLARSSSTSYEKSPRRRQSPSPPITPPTVTEEKTVLENVTDISRHYGEALSGRFAQLYRNITDSPHKPFSTQAFTNALTHFLMLAASVFVFYWLIRLCALPLYRKMGQWARKKIATAATGYSFPQ